MLSGDTVSTQSPEYILGMYISAKQGYDDNVNVLELSFGFSFQCLCYDNVVLNTL